MALTCRWRSRTDIDTGLAMRIRKAYPITHQPAGLGNLAVERVDRLGSGLAHRRQCNELRATAGQDRLSGLHQERVGLAPMHQSGKGRLDVSTSVPAFRTSYLPRQPP